MNSFKEKIQDWATAERTVKRWKATGNEIVFTNGCFDLLHYGHVEYLYEASLLGTKLVVALNSDESVQALKGKHRPINNQLSRTFIMASIGFVDLVVVFGEPTPYSLIQLLEPDVLVKGGDWKPEQIIGSDLVLAKGGKVESLRFAEGYSTTSLEQKILNKKF